MNLKYAAIALAVVTNACTAATVHAAEEKPKANVQQDRLNKLNGKALGRVIYSGATVIDGTSAAPRTGMSIIVSDDRIEAVLPSAQLSEAQKTSARVVDVTGQYVLPGLIDSHVHYATNPDRPYAEAELKRNIYGGVTGVRDMAGDARELAGLSREALLNRIPSPDVFFASLVAGPTFFKDPRTVVAALGTQPGTVPWLYSIDDKTKMPLAIAQARGTGATGMKIYANLPGPLVRKLIAEGKAQKFPVWTHMQVYPASPYDSLGASAISHVCMIARYVRESDKAAYGHSGEPSYEGLTAEDPGIKKYIAALAKSGTIMDATLSVYKTEGPRCRIELAGDITRAMHKAGIKIIAGTDTDNTGEDPFPVVDHELEKLVKYAGFTPQEAIIAATANAAEALGKQKEFGTLEAGKLANMVFVRRDPLQDIGNLRSVVLTVKRGHEFARADYKFTPLPVHED
ncbi:amidohydrolase family protein [Duganella sp. BuS-21]|uniref:amidohydrolase family protein n=1 Tax=Duganella sp. BuS-21 TaxID=2943848 RepID=UPI0035A6DF8B